MAWKSAVIAAIIAAPMGAQSLSSDARRGIQLVEAKVYTKAAEVLGDALEQDPKNATVAENLGIAALYAADGLNEKSMMSIAFKAVHAAVESGGRATFLADRSLKGSVENIVDVERGRIHFHQDRIEYKAERAQTAFTIAPDDLEVYGFNLKSRSADKGSFYLRTRKNKAKKQDSQRYDFRPASFQDREGRLLFALIDRWWKGARREDK
jgi:hypothetical protein